MNDNRTVCRLKPGLHSEVEIVFEGATKANGSLGDISQYFAYINTSGTIPNIAKCFVRLQVSGKQYYSRGKVIRKDDDGIVVQLENWFPIFSELLKQDILTVSSTLGQILQYKKTKGILDEAEKMHLRQRDPNCWEVIKCGKENYCAAGTDPQYDGLFGGHNGGRFCAFIPDTLCKDGLPRNLEQKTELCAECLFYNEIINEVLPKH